MFEKWIHRQPVEIQAGPNASAGLENYIDGRKVLLVTTEGLIRRGAVERLLAALPVADWLTCPVPPNPELDYLDAAARLFREKEVGVVVAFGGGSAMDSAKAFAAALAGEVGWTLERHLNQKPGPPPLTAALPIYCLPTTAGTGAEVTPFATIWDMKRRKKLSLDDQCLYPRAAFLEPEWTISLPESETRWGGLDAISHALESLWSRRASPVSLAWAREALALVLEALPQALVAPDNLTARASLQQSSLLAGLAISQNRTALAHAVSYPLTVHFGMPHGLACSFTLSALVDLVTENEAWIRPGDAALAARAVELLEGQNLAGWLSAYVTQKEVMDLWAEMFTPGRADNFRVQMTKTSLKSVLQKSVNYNGSFTNCTVWR